MKARAQHHTRRPTVTRVVTGGLLFGPLGALAGFAWQKPTINSIEIDTKIDEEIEQMKKDLKSNG